MRVTDREVTDTRKRKRKKEKRKKDRKKEKKKKQTRFKIKFETVLQTNYIRWVFCLFVCFSSASHKSN